MSKRKSERLEKRKNEEFSFPSRKERLDASGGIPTKIIKMRFLTPLKTVNKDVVSRYRYNCDQIDIYESEGSMEDFIDDTIQPSQILSEDDTTDDPTRDDSDIENTQPRKRRKKRRSRILNCLNDTTDSENEDTSDSKCVRARARTTLFSQELSGDKWDDETGRFPEWVIAEMMKPFYSVDDDPREDESGPLPEWIVAEMMKPFYSDSETEDAKEQSQQNVFHCSEENDSQQFYVSRAHFVNRRPARIIPSDSEDSDSILNPTITRKTGRLDHLISESSEDDEEGTRLVLKRLDTGDEDGKGRWFSAL